MKKTWIILLLTAASFAAAAGRAPVTYERLLRSADEPHNWLMYSGGYAGWRHSRLSEVNASNVDRLQVQWIFQTGAPGAFETNPLVVDGIMYLTAPDNHAYALDARTGRTLWHYKRALPERPLLCCGKVNRGLAVLGDRAFFATLDAHVVALDSKTGNVLWDTEAIDYRKGYSFTVAPLVIKDKVVVGVAGGEFGVRGFIDAYDTTTGNRVWRFYTTAAPGEPGNETWSGDSWKTGSATAWVTGSYDPELDLTYWGTGNPGPDAYGGDRKGNNLYSDSMVALDPDTGKLKWHFQFTPHDVHDWDSTQVPILLDAEFRGQPRKLLVTANRNGFFYVLDRTNGKFLLAKAYAKQTWAKEIGPDGRPAVLPGTAPTEEGNYVCPGVPGGANWPPPAYSPQTGLFYVAVLEQCAKYYSIPQKYREGHVFWGSGAQDLPGERGWGALRAIDPRTGEIKWEFKYHSPPWDGVLSTAGGLVFAGDMEGYLMAFDARSGKLLWHFQTGAAIQAAPMTYAIDGRQYVAIPAGTALFAFGVSGPAARRQAPATQSGGR